MSTKIQCPNCKTSIDVNEVLKVRLEHTMRAQLEEEFLQREATINKKVKDFESRVEKLAKDKLELDKTVDARTTVLLETREKSLRDKISKEIISESAAQINLLNEELQRKSKQLKELNSTKAQVEALKREMDELEAQITLKKERELSERLEEAKAKIKEQVKEESQFKLKEREKIIQDLSNKLDDAKRKAEQGSVQLQGEIQELELISVLQEMHPMDEITQSKKGANGADVLHLIKSETNNLCGKIYYESKRTKTWSNEWIPKLKKDNRSINADILVVVTNALPKGVTSFGLVEGVWVCAFNDVMELSLVLKYGLLKLHDVAITQNGKESKMELLYGYLTSNEFKNAFTVILEGYRSLQEMHNTEKIRIQRMWKEREKRLEYILANVVDFYGAIKGIAGKEIPEMKLLEGQEEQE